MVTEKKRVRYGCVPMATNRISVDLTLPLMIFIQIGIVIFNETVFIVENQTINRKNPESKWKIQKLLPELLHS